eukprot:5251337-Lingulodinium_polyedra.AAC.1
MGCARATRGLRTGYARAMRMGYARLRKSTPGTHGYSWSRMATGSRAWPRVVMHGWRVGYAW